MRQNKIQLKKKRRSMQKIVIVGAGENGFVVKNILAYNRFYNIHGFLDDGKNGKNILGKVSDFSKYKEQGCWFFVSIGTNSSRKKVFEILAESKVKFINAIHPSAYIEPDVRLGLNVMVGAQSYVNIGSRIGDNTLVNNGCTVEHDNLIGRHCHLAPGAITGGGVTIGDGTFIGLNSTVRDHVRIGRDVLVGMGSTVVRNLPDSAVAMGCPAKMKY